MEPIQNNVKVMELSHTVQTKLLQLKDYKDKAELLKIANRALDIINDDDTVSTELKQAYQIAITKFSNMSWQDIQANLENIKNHL